MKKTLIFIFIILSIKTGFTQNTVIDSLSIELALQKVESFKIDTS